MLLLAAQVGFQVALPLGWLAVPLTVTAVSNLLLERLATAVGARQALGMTLTLDTLSLTALLALTGGPTNPFTLLYIVEIALSAVVLGRAWTWALGVLSVGGFGLLFFANVPLPLFEAHHHATGFSAHLTGMWIAFAAATLLITISIGKVSQTLRKREEELLLLKDRLAQHERVASIASLAAGAAHELGTPLATIAVAAKELEVYAREVSKDASVAEEARLIRSQVERCGDILRQISLRGAQPVGENPTLVSLDDLVERAKSDVVGSRPLPVRTRAAPGIKALLPSEATRQTLMALLRNAVDSTPDGRGVELSAERVEETLRFIVRDQGPGMSPETLSRVGEPFFSTKAPGRGLGLGIFLARIFAESLEGHLTFESELGSGTTATLDLPLHLS